MLLTEYRGKRLLGSHCLAIPEGRLVRNRGELAADGLSYPVAVKAQVASGGRGKAGGVLKAESPGEAEAAVDRILGARFAGEAPEAVLVEAWQEIQREFYLSITVDGGAGGYVLLYSPHGGVDIEDAPPPVAYAFGAPASFRAHRLREFLAGVEEDRRLREELVRWSRRLLRLAVSQDCTMVEINPLAQVASGVLVAMDAKVVRDESAWFRSAAIAQEIAESRALEAEMTRRCLSANLMLVRLEGDVGLISGGAGMTMAIMDLIAAAGGRPACFLDCSANPTPGGYQLAFELLDGDPGVRVILVSIFGGGTQMDRVARVMGRILGERTSTKPVVFYLNGTNAALVPAAFAQFGQTNHVDAEAAVEDAVRMAREAA